MFLYSFDQNLSFCSSLNWVLLEYRNIAEREINSCVFPNQSSSSLQRLIEFVFRIRAPSNGSKGIWQWVLSKQPNKFSGWRIATVLQSASRIPTPGCLFLSPSNQKTWLISTRFTTGCGWKFGKLRRWKNQSPQNRLNSFVA
jgi:hypothetical protein